MNTEQEKQKTKEEYEAEQYEMRVKRNLPISGTLAGDANDRTFTNYEIAVTLPNYLKAAAELGRCAGETRLLRDCHKTNNFGIMSIFRCLDVHRSRAKCVDRLVKEKVFVKKIKEKYLSERSEFRIFRDELKASQEEKKRYT